MAKIVQYEERIAAPTSAGVTPSVVPIRRTSPYGDAFRNLSGQVDALERREEERARAWAAENLSAVRLQWTEEFVRRQQSAEPGAPEFTPKLLEDFDKHTESLIEGAPNDAAKRFMAVRMADLRAGIGSQALAFESQAQIDYRSDQFKNGIQNVRRLMNTDPAQYQIALAEQFAILDQAELPPVQKSSLKAWALESVSQAAVLSQIQKSPTKFLQNIGFLPVIGPDGKVRKSDGPLAERTGNMAFDALSFEKRMAAVDTAIKAHNQIEADAERAARKQSDGAGDAALKEAYARNADGRLTREYVDSVRELIKPSEYLGLLKMLSGESVLHNNRDALATVSRLMYSDPDAAERYIHTAYRRGELTDGTYTAELARAHGLQRQSGPKSEYEMSRAYIVTNLDPGPFVQDPIGKARFGDALDTFDRWVNAAKRTDEEIYKRGREIVNQYKFINLSETIIALPAPRSGNIRRQPQNIDGMRADIAAAVREAQRRKDAKRLTEEEYDNEMQIIRRWINAVEELSRGR